VETTTNVKGQLAVSKAELRAFELGFLPSRPLYDSRYDLIIDMQGKLVRVQVKYANGKPSHATGAVVVKLDYENRKKKFYTYQTNEVDALIVYLPQVNRLCWLPPEKYIGKRKIHIRITSPKSGQIKNITFARDYFW